MKLSLKQRVELVSWIGLFGYAVGEILQLFGVGPFWIRWYLSDFAFPLLVGYKVASWFPKSCWRTGVSIGVALGFFAECIQALVGKHDVLDVVVITAGALLGLVILGKAFAEKHITKKLW